MSSVLVVCFGSICDIEPVLCLSCQISSAWFLHAKSGGIECKSLVSLGCEAVEVLLYERLVDLLRILNQKIIANEKSLL